MSIYNISYDYEGWLGDPEADPQDELGPKPRESWFSRMVRDDEERKRFVPIQRCRRCSVNWVPREFAVCMKCRTWRAQ